MSEHFFSKTRDFLRCPRCLAELNLGDAGTLLIGQNDALHKFPIVDNIPSFVKREEISPEDAKWVFEYNEKAEKYDEYVKRYDEWLGVNLEKERLRMFERISVKSSQRILDVSTGTGAVILELKKVYPDVPCKFVGTDLSFGMLRVAQRKFARASVEVPLFHSHVKELPFENQSFDIVTHFGGINTFRDIPSALKEWVRVLKPEGVLVVADEGLSPSARKTQRGAEIIKANSLFGLQPPLEHLPHQVKNIELRWVAKDTFYVITCQKLSKEELQNVEYQTIG